MRCGTLLAIVLCSVIQVHSDEKYEYDEPLMKELFSGQYDPDVDLSTPQLIRKYGYPSEAHVVETADGYLLTLHRIPHGRNISGTRRVPIFLHHGLLASSTGWVLTGPEKGLAYILADAGYDVWMANARGNTYSRRHVELSSSDFKFWDFSFHEIGIYDVPAAIDYILSMTGYEKVYYIGHSMGTTVFFVTMSMRPEYNEKVHAMIALAPVAFVSNMKSPIRLLAPFTKDLEFISHYIGKGEFLPQDKILKIMAKFGCELVTTEKICENTMFILSGFDPAQFNTSLLPKLLSHTPAGTSTKNVIHYAQEIKSAKFETFDNSDYCRFHTTEEEQKLCTEVSSPVNYNISNIRVPIDIYYAENDWLATKKDVMLLAEKLPNKMGMHLVPYKNFNHIDFLWATDVVNLLYVKVLKALKENELHH